MRKLSLSAIVLLVICGLAAADTYSNGYVNSDGYSYRDGYWYYPGSSQAYYRTLQTTPGYWRCGYYYPGSSYYFYQTYTPSYTAPAAVSYDTPNWEVELLKIAAQRDKFEGQIRKSLVDHARYMEAIKALGLQGNFRWDGYGTIPPSIVPQGSYPGTMPYTLSGHAYHNTSYGAQASTQYGYSTLANLYGSSDLNALYQQAAQLAQGSQRLSSEATAGFQGAISAEGTNRARVAEILVRGQVAAQVLQALSSAPSSETKGISFKVSPGGAIERVEDGSRDPIIKASSLKQLQSIIGEKCAMCHSGKVLKGKLDLAEYPSFSPEKKQRVLERILMTPANPDYANRMMPRDPNDEGKPGTPLTEAEKRAFMLN